MNYNILKTFVIIAAFLASCSSSNEDSLIDEHNNLSNIKVVGASANDLLSEKNYQNMVIEIAYVKDFKPTDKAINLIEEFVKERTFKPGGIKIVLKELPRLNKQIFTIKDIKEIEKTYRTIYTKDTTIAIWMLFINGSSENNENVLGTAYLNTSFVIFEERIKNLTNSTFASERSLLEATVIAHEFGHILGLTNLGSSMQQNHEDVEHKKHCNNKECLMYWSVETEEGIAKLLSNGEIPNLDNNCILDLQANGGK